MAEHVGPRDQVFAVLRRLRAERHARLRELVQVRLVPPVALLAEAEVVARSAVEVQLSSVDGSLAPVASEPSLVLFLVCLSRLLLPK